jgi:hypothetical protein
MRGHAFLTVLERLESYACYEVGHQGILATGAIRLFGRDAYLDAALGGVGWWPSLTLYGPGTAPCEPIQTST